MDIQGGIILAVPYLCEYIHLPVFVFFLGKIKILNYFYAG